ncbi:MAG: DUF3012 domain-containing protein [Motiliproteus sp.]
MKNKISVLSALLLGAVLVSGCAPEVGSEDWCKDLKAKPKGEWSGNEVADFAKHCVFK